MSVSIPDDVLYLVHTTSKKRKDLEKGIVWKEIHTRGGDQHPGAYFSLITKANRTTEKLFPATECLIFSRNLLLQKNYHINLCDNNGFITEGNTFFPDNLVEAVAKIRANSLLPLLDGVNYHRMNEVVFHDPVPLEYLCRELETQFFDADFLPDYPIENAVAPNTGLLPFYSFLPIKGISRYESSDDFYKITFAKRCNIDDAPNKSMDEIIEEIKDLSKRTRFGHHPTIL